MSINVETTSVFIENTIDFIRRSSMLISTFELLLKSQLPTDLPPTVPPEAKNLSRNVIQGYFLTISNLSSVDIVLSLVFTTRLNPPTTLDKLITFLILHESIYLAT